MLVSPKNPNLTQRIIRTVQDTFHEDHQEWTHCGVYIGEYMICEATTSDGVKVANLLDYLPNYSLRFRRPTQGNKNERWSIAIRALMRLNEEYDWKAIARLARGWPIGLHNWRSSKRRDSAAICSMLYWESYGEATNRILVETPDAIALPADLSATENLRDQDVRWGLI